MSDKSLKQKKGRTRFYNKQSEANVKDERAMIPDNFFYTASSLLFFLWDTACGSQRTSRTRVGGGGRGGGGVVKQRGTRAEAQAKKEYLKFA